MLRTIFSHLNNKLTISQNGSSKVYQKSSKNEEKIGEETNDQITSQQNDTLYNFEAQGKIIFAESVNNSDKNQLFTIKLNDKTEHSTYLEDIKWKAVIGDKVKVSGCKITDGVMSKLEIKKIYPKKKLMEINRVTGLGDGYAVFEDNKIMFYEILKTAPSLKIFDEYKIEYIESEQKSGLSSYDYRVINLLEKVENRYIGNGIIFENKPFRIYLNQDNEKKEVGIKHIKIFNRSDKTAILKSIKIIPFVQENKKLICCEDKKLNFTMKPKIGSFRAFFNINPSKMGKFYFYLIANFTEFDEKYEFSIEILKAHVLPGEKFHKTPRFVDKPISEHGIPKDLREIDFGKFSNAKKELEIQYPCLKKDLMPLNYHDKVKLGIYLEELAMETAFANYHIDNGTFETKGDFLKLTVKDVAERRPSIIIGDKVVATETTTNDDKEKMVYEGYIHKVGDESVFCKFHSDFHEQHKKQNDEREFSIDFIFSRSIFRRQHHALETFISNGDLGYNFLFPNDKICRNTVQLDAEVDADGNLCIEKCPKNWFNNHLNKYQRDAVVNVLRGENRPLPYIFFGCPGTGKTQTCVETILQIHKNINTSKIIVATPSNSAANLILEMLINSETLDKDNPVFLRIVSNNQVEKELIPDYLTKYCGTVSIASDNGQKSSPTKNNLGILQNCTRSHIMDFKIIIATLNGIGTLMQMSFDSYFSHVIIDEAGQCIEPEAVIPLTLMSSKGQCVFSGDPKQLGPIAISRFASQYKFNISMLERFVTTHPYYAKNFGAEKNEYDPKFVTKLKINYRSHPSVLKVYNDIFYNGELESAVDSSNSLEALFLASIQDTFWKDINNKCGVIFVNVANGKNKKLPESCSWYNEQEINAVISFLKKCHENNIPFKKIGILTPYTLQVKKLKNQIAAFNDSDLKVGTVEEFQGQERLVVAVSTVRTEQRHLNSDNKYGLGFLQCPKRINVAVSRARALLVIFGKQSILEKDPNWKSLIEYTKANNSFISENY